MTKDTPETTPSTATAPDSRKRSRKTKDEDDAPELPAAKRTTAARNKASTSKRTRAEKPPGELALVVAKLEKVLAEVAVIKTDVNELASHVDAMIRAHAKTSPALLDC